MLDALFLGNHNWILPAPIVSTPFSCFPSVKELLLILRRRVACFADSFFKRSLSSPIFQVNFIFVLGTLDSSVLLLLSACSMARGQEDTSTSQAGRKRGPDRDTSSASSIISSLSMEELRPYCQIPNNIDNELPEGLTESTIDKEDGAVYFTQH